MAEISNISELACSCITCGDQAIDMQIVALDTASGLATCIDPVGESSEVDLGLLDEVAVGAHVLVHAGTAIAIAPDEAAAPAGAAAPAPRAEPVR